jgi:hypothetical protein
MQAEETEENKLYAKLAAEMELDTVSLENIEFRFRKLILQLPKESTSPENLASILLPAVIARIFFLLNNLLPPANQLASHRIFPLLNEVAQCLFPTDVQNNFYYTINLASLLDVEDAGKQVPALAPLNELATVWLKLQAGDRLRKILAEAAAAESPNQTLLDNARYYKDIYDGFLPSGFNTETNARWRSINFEALLDKTAEDPCVAWRQLSAEESRTLMTRAMQFKLDLEESRKETPLTAEQEAQLVWLTEIVEKQQLPHGFSLAK